MIYFVLAPISFVILTGLGFIVTYSWSYYNNHIVKPPLWPYVSDTGDSEPESCFFTFLLILAAAFGSATFYLYYKYTEHVYGEVNLNKYSLRVGLFSCFCLTVVASFQFSTVRFVHSTAASLGFTGMVTYFWLVTYMSYKHRNKLNNKLKILLWIRLVLVLVDTLFGLLLGIALCFQVANKEKSGNYNFSSISEWLLIYFAIFLTGTLAVEISQIKQVNVSISLNKGAQILENEEDPTQVPNVRFKNKKVTNDTANNEHRFTYNDRTNILEVAFEENT